MTVLIVDDEMIQIDGMTRMIKRLYPDVVTLSALNGQEALDLLDNNLIDVVFTDIKMPILDGLEMLKLWRLKGYSTARPPFFIIFSGFDEFSYAQLAIRYGAIDYQLKPLDIHSISRLLERIFSSIEHYERDRYNMEEVATDQLISQIHHYILEHIDEKFGLEEIAMRFAYHPSYFSTLWKRKTNTPFSIYLQDTKMKKAAELLGKTDLRVSVVAQKVGYSDEKYFCRVFKKHFGNSPQTYRRAKRSRGI